MKELITNDFDKDIFQRENNVFKRCPRIKRATPLLERKIELEKVWETQEIKSILPAAKLQDNRLGGEPFSVLSGFLLILALLAVIPIPFIALPVYKMYKRRMAILKEIKEINKELKSILPTKFCPERDVVPNKYKYLIPYFFKEGLFFNASGKEILRDI